MKLIEHLRKELEAKRAFLVFVTAPGELGVHPLPLTENLGVELTLLAFPTRRGKVTREAGD